MQQACDRTDADRVVGRQWAVECLRVEHARQNHQVECADMATTGPSLMRPETGGKRQEANLVDGAGLSQRVSIRLATSDDAQAIATHGSARYTRDCKLTETQAEITHTEAPAQPERPRSNS